MYRRALLMTAALLLLAGSLCRAQTATSHAQEPAPEGTIEAGGADAEAPKRKLVHWNANEGDVSDFARDSRARRE